MVRGGRGGRGQGSRTHHNSYKRYQEWTQPRDFSEDPTHGDGESENEQSKEIPFALTMWDFDHCDPKRCSGRRLERMGILKELKLSQAFHAIGRPKGQQNHVPVGTQTVSPDDRDIILREINKDLFEKYSSCKGSEEVIQVQNEYIAQMELENEMKKSKISDSYADEGISSSEDTESSCDSLHEGNGSAENAKSRTKTITDKFGNTMEVECSDSE
ncbi:Ribosome biogenesis protein TSR3 [Zancudomyces culisetae]|uniref:Ribosome biogenesis protein TSR3 n=1 Tax=Zancudomyces culisetae TaxID=1213189 RepID=A0A1R1PQC7_ZANCU|nr:Ribosome biogenesis protein TSR3 [Zancudomyces culisetae]OMH83170.1 Ribosome biogenesis protein TSR3 [Zancudomyces culisetae]|eukprot:OMH79282.1 Ribosome biogenesis protein TSR3 [Zancudomyces culisetae]